MNLRFYNSASLYALQNREREIIKKLKAYNTPFVNTFGEYDEIIIELNKELKSLQYDISRAEHNSPYNISIEE